jgi:hypothetical protein
MILRPAVPHIRTAFHRLLEPLDRRIIARAVAAHGGDHGVGGGDNAGTCERHLKSLLFAQWAGLSGLREIVAVRSDHDQPLYLLTNDPQRPAVDIAQLHKQRWNIELLFKWLKQNLKIRRFLGRSENAVRIQIYGALIAFMLLRVLHHTAAQTAPLCCSRTSNSACSAPSISANSTRPSQAAVIAAAKPPSRLRPPMKPNLPKKSRTAVRESRDAFPPIGAGLAGVTRRYCKIQSDKLPHPDE